MRDIFLGRPWHWGLIALVVALLWWAGSAKAHVIHFNVFLVALSVGSLVVVLLLIKLHTPGEQVTRETLVLSETEDEENAPEDAGP